MSVQNRQTTVTKMQCAAIPEGLSSAPAMVALEGMEDPVQVGSVVLFKEYKDCYINGIFHLCKNHKCVELFSHSNLSEYL